MLSVTFEAFQDELIKIASSVFQPIPARKPAGMHLHGVGGDAPLTAEGRGRSPVAAAGPELSKTVQRPTPVAAPHSALPHPAVPGGAGRMVQRGKGLLKAHGKKGLIGAGVLGSEILVNKLMGGE